MDSIVTWNNIQLITRIPMVSPIFQASVVFWSPPDQGQCQRPHSADCKDNEGCSEIPWQLFFGRAYRGGASQKLSAVFTLYRGVLYIFSAEGTLFYSIRTRP
jgi:hypothetical protein